MSQNVFGALRALLILAFVAAASWRLAAAGLQYDEVLFVNAALGGIDDVFVHLRLYGIPVMTMAYIGALKSWLHAPVFALLGVSPWTIRLPSVLICGAALYVYSALADALFGRGLALLLLVVLATDPALFAASRFDFGPFVLMIFLKAAALLAFVAWLRRPSGWRLWGLCLLLALGTYDKLNFVWFALALGATSLAVYARATLRALRASGAGGWLAVAAAAVATPYVAVTAIVPLLRDSAPAAPNGSLWLERAVSVWQLASGSLEGGQLWGVLLSGDSPERVVTSLALALALLAVLPLLARGAAPARDPILGGPARVACFFAMLFAAVFVEMLVTPQASGPHHAMMLFPLHVFVLFGVLGCALERAGERRRLAGAVAVAVLASLVVSQVGWIAMYLDRVRDGAAFHGWTDPAIYELARIVRSERADAVVSTDWGLHTQLFALAAPEERTRYLDRWASFNQKNGPTAEQRAHLLEVDFARPKVLAVLHAPQHAMMKDARAAYLALEREALRQTAPPLTIRNAAGEPLYEIHFVTSR